MRAARPTFGVLAALAMASAAAQMTYPDCYIQNVDWTSGTHYIGVPQPVIAPGHASMPTSVSGTAEAELVSGTQVRLTPGFHAGDLNGSGRFRARIDQSFGSPDDIVVITPDPTTHVEDDILHVEKWEKLEIGLRLPQDYQEAIERFFDHYYPDAPTNYAANPSNTDDAHDLNPYADDSLVMYMTLTDPVGTQRLKWGFYMKEGAWASNDPLAQLAAADPATNALVPYTARFRFAPDKEGLWQFNISVRAPHTATPANEPLQPLQYMGYSFICDPPLPDNNGYLQVNENNRRTLQFQGDKDTPGDETPFFALGVNLADKATSDDYYHKSDFTLTRDAMVQLGEVGGNFVRIFMMRNTFAPEWVNLGVYDAYKELHCYAPPNNGNCQYQCRAFDQIVDHARDNGIYLQLCIDPYPPIKAFQSPSWEAHAYIAPYLEPTRNSVLGTFNMLRFFHSLDPITSERLYDSGVFYYWKRKYKYIMSRWGYSVNIPIVEPFNETDQMLSFDTVDLTPVLGGDQHYDICPPNKRLWLANPGLRSTIDEWLTDIITFVRDPVAIADPISSPLGEEHKLFLMSYAGSISPNDPDYATHYIPFTNPRLDLMDVHMGISPNPSQANSPDGAINSAVGHAQEFWDNFPTPNAAVEDRKPFNQGDFSHYTNMTFGSWKNDIEKIFHNYDVSFHNELWASAFSGKFAASNSWHWGRVFWWEDLMPVPPWEENNQVVVFNNPSGSFSNMKGVSNYIDILGNPVEIKNRALYHHFKPLADLLNRPSWLAYDFLSGDYFPEKSYSTGNHLEAYYLKNSEKTVAIGWMHNRNAWMMNNHYLASGQYQNFLGCDPPNTEAINLPGFINGTDYYVSWFPTRMNSTTVPPDMQVTGAGGSITLDMTGHFGGVDNNYLDTLRTDYAFVITTDGFVKSLHLTAEAAPPLSTGWDFNMYPNPAQHELFIQLPDDATNEIALHDLSGRRIQSWSSATALLQRLAIDYLAKGVYTVRVSDGTNTKTKKLIIH